MAIKSVIYYSFLIFLFTIIACNNPETNNNFQISNKYYYAIDSIESNVKWIRSVDNKLVKKKVKLFGNYVDVEMENVQFSAEGKFNIITGQLTRIDTLWQYGLIELDFSALKLYSQEYEKFFIYKDYPKTILEINSFIPDTIENSFVINASLQILDSIKTISFPVLLYSDSSNNINLSGTFGINTLNWPLKESIEPENVRKDSIIINMELRFLLNEIKSDTIIITN